MSSNCSERGCAHLWLALSSSAADLQLGDMLLPPRIVAHASSEAACQTLLTSASMEDNYMQNKMIKEVMFKAHPHHG